MFYLKNNILTRELAIRLQFDAPISYKEFITHEEYKLLFEKNAKKEVIRGLTFRGFHSLWELDGLHGYELIFQKLLENSIDEKYHNADQLFPNLSEQSNILYKIQSGETISKSEQETLNFWLDDIKFAITNNKYFYKIDDKFLSSKANLVTPYWKFALETNDGILPKKEKVKLRKRVSLTQEEKEHQIVEYLLFITLTTNLDLFLVLDPQSNSYTITSKDEINSEFSGSFGLFICVSKLIRSLIEYKSIQFLDTIKAKYDFSKDESPEFIKDLLEIIKKSPSSRIQINASKGFVRDLTFSNRDQDLNNYSELKDFKRGEIGTTRVTGIEEHGTEKKAIISTGKIKYGKKKKK